MNNYLDKIKKNIRTIKDHPKKDYIFYDITGILSDYTSFSYVIKLISEYYKNHKITKVVGTEARGFLFGAPVALSLGAGFVPARKYGKLPGSTVSEKYKLEYGTDSLEIHKNSINSKDKVLIVDDLLATGGTIEATYNLIKKLGGKVHDAAFIINLYNLSGEERLKKLNIKSFSLIKLSSK